MNNRYSPNEFIDETTQSLTEADSAISLLGKAILPKAAELARTGKYLEAEGLLQHLIQEGSGQPEVYDLLARIRAQQGRLLEAQSYWADAIQLSSAKEFYRAALKRIEHLQICPAWAGRIRPLLLGLGLLMSIVILIIVISLPHLGEPKAPTIKTAKHNWTQRIIAEPAAKTPQVEINIPGIVDTIKGHQVVLSFERGLFLNHTELQPNAKAILDLLADQLRPYIGKIQVNVEGHTDDLPISNGWIYRDNVSLGLQRSVTVIEYLRLKGQLPAKMFRASSTGDLQSLYPNDTPHNQMRNRTVVIRITALKED